MALGSMPEFGCLRDVKLVVAGGGLASAFGGCLLAENGAEGIHLESQNAMDSARGYNTMFFGNEHRNGMELGLEISKPEGKAVLEKLIKRADIFMESLKGGTFEKWGLGDEVLWSWNPKLVIVHISGYGQYGDPDYIHRASFDMIGQAFSGLSMLNGLPEPGLPDFAKPMLCDYITGLTAALGGVMALHRAQKTGVGESVDVTQYESVLRCQNYQVVEGFTNGKEPERYVGADASTVADAYYKCSDGKYVTIVIAGAGPFKKGIKIIGLDGDPDFANKTHMFKTDPAGDKFLNAIRAFCLSKTSEEVEKAFNEVGVPCSKLMTYSDMLANPHYAARNNIVEFYSPQADQNLKAQSPAPKFKRNPQQIWRGGARLGEDNKTILTEIGLSEAEIMELKDKGIVGGFGF